MAFVPEVLRKGIIQPKYILAIVVILIVMIAGMSLYELSTSSKDIMRVLREEAISLAESISVVSDNALICFDRFADMAVERLLNNARALECLDYEGHLDRKIASDTAKKNNIHQIAILEDDGRQSWSFPASSTLPDPTTIGNIAPLINGDESEMVIELGEDMEEDRVAVGVHRRKGGAIVLVAEVDELSEFRRSIGIGSPIQAIGENEGIEYIVLQDKMGLILASKNVTEMEKIVGDSFLEDALQNKVLDTRIYSYDGKEVMEVVSPFQLDHSSFGLFRIGLSMKEVHAVRSRSRQRLILTTLIAFTAGIVSLGFVFVNQNYRLLSGAYERIQTYTGTILKNIADGVVVSDKKGVISVFNKSAERIFRRPAHEMIGAKTVTLGPAIESFFTSVTDDRLPSKADEFAVEVPGAGSRLLSIHAGWLDTEDGGSVVAVIRDITEERLIEENMRRAEQLTAMGKLASAVAHEVRNPLNAISMIAQRLSREFVPEREKDNYYELINTIRSESSRLNRIIENFLQFARPPKLNRQPTDMDQVLDEIIALIIPQAEGRGIDVQKGYSGLGIWTVDSQQLKQALLNILLNGIEAMPGGGILSVKAKKEDERLSIEISDTGKGIPKEDISKIFDLYFTTKETGTGLGLSIAQRVITEHNGWISVDSEPGIGTTFSIYIRSGDIG